MKFLYSDSLDMLDPGFDFDREKFAEDRADSFNYDVFAHQLMPTAPYDGLLVSLATVGTAQYPGSRYSFSRAMRLQRDGARKFLRLQNAAPDFMIMGDCGSFSYSREDLPRFTIDEVADFYDHSQFTHGASLDHIIFTFDETVKGMDGGTQEDRRRYDITLENAREFLTVSRSIPGFTPMGVVQGWSPDSMAEAARRLVAMGYDYLALGGMVPLKADQIKNALLAIRSVVPDVKIHILGFAKADDIADFLPFKITSFDTSSPLIRAFKDAKANFYLRNAFGGMDYFCAIRIPQALENRDLMTLAKMGIVNQEKLQRMERDALSSLKAYDRFEIGAEEVIDAVMAYSTGGVDPSDQRLNGISVKLPGAASAKGLRERYRKTLEARPWRVCGCAVCEQIGVDVMVYRGVQRNKRRGVHNLEQFHSLVRDLRCENITDLPPHDNAVPPPSPDIPSLLPLIARTIPVKPKTAPAQLLLDLFQEFPTAA